MSNDVEERHHPDLQRHRHRCDPPAGLAEESDLQRDRDCRDPVAVLAAEPRRNLGRATSGHWLVGGPGVKHLRSRRRCQHARKVFEISAHLGIAGVLRCPRALGGLGRAILRVPDRLVLVGRLHTK